MMCATRRDNFNYTICSNQVLSSNFRLFYYTFDLCFFGIIMSTVDISSHEKLSVVLRFFNLLLQRRQQQQFSFIYNKRDTNL